MSHDLLVEQKSIETAIAPIDITGAATQGDWISLKQYGHLTIVLIQGAWAGGTPAVTLEQATAVAGTGNKTLGFTKRWTQVGLTGTGYTETAVTSDTFNLPAVANTINVLEVSASDLDTANDFDCVSVLVASPGANADLLAVLYLVGDAVHEGSTLVDPKVD